MPPIKEENNEKIVETKDKIKKNENEKKESSRELKFYIDNKLKESSTTIKKTWKNPGLRMGYHVHRYWHALLPG